MNKLFVKYPLLIIVILAVLLRLPLLNGSFWMDEAAQALEVIRPLNQQLDIIADFQPPLLHLILHFAQYFSVSEWYLRTIGALIPGLITIIYTYKIAETLFSKRVAMIAGLLLATSSFHIFFSQELRPYSLPTAFALMSMYHFIVSVESKKKFNLFGKNTDDNMVFLTIYNVLGLYSSYLYPFFMLAQISYSIFNLKFKKAKELMISFGFSIMAFVPFIPIFLKQLAEGGNVRNSLPGWDQVVSINQLKALPLVFGKLIFGILPLDINPIIVLLTTLLGISAVGATFYVFKNYKKYNLKIFFYWLVVPLLTAWLVSFVVPVIRPKRLLFLLPGIYILISHLGTNTLEKYLRNKLKNVSFIEKTTLFLILSVVLINFVGIVGYFTMPSLQREDWRSLNNQIHQDFKVQETLLVYSFPNQFAPMKWYERTWENEFPIYSTNKLYIEDVNDLANDIKLAANYKTILVFDYLRDLTDPNKKIEKYLIDLGFKEVGVLDYPNIGFVRVFMHPVNVIGYK